MKNAKFLEYDINVHLSCPDCSTVFHYVNYDIPTHVPTYHVCDGCDKPLLVRPLSIDVKFARLTSKVASQYPLIDKACSAMVSKGFGKKESLAMIESVYDQSLSLSELIKKAISTYNRKEQ